MRSNAGEEAEVLAGLFGEGRASRAIAGSTATSAAARIEKESSAPRIVVVIMLSVATLLALVFSAPALIETWPPIAGTAAFSAVLASLAWVAARAAGGRLLGPGRQAVRQSALWGMIGLAALAWCVLALAVGKRLQPDESSAGIGVVIGLAAVSLQAIGEELFFRGWMQSGIMRMAPASIALLVTAATFAAVHLAGSWFEPLSLINILLAGLWFGMLAQRTGGLAAPIAAHWGWNAAEMCIFGLYPNPGVGPWGALIGRDIIGAPLWGGGEEGLNASLLASLTLAAIVLSLVGTRRGQLT